MDSHHSINGLKPFFEPGSTAIIGASRTPGKAGHNMIENLLKLGYQGEIYPINPNVKNILGLTVYPDLKHTPKTPELAVIMLPPSMVLAALEDCIARGTKAVIILSAGFAETDEAGAVIEKKIAQTARQAGVRVMGPNSIGTINPSANFDSSFVLLRQSSLPHDEMRSGTVAFAGQTGLFTGAYLPLISPDMGIGKIACLGNKCDVDESDILEYLGDDPSIKIIAMYLESIKDGRRFMNLSRRITREKPVIALKSARTEGGARVSASHTGSIAGEDRVYDAAFKQSGIIRVSDFEQLWNVTKAFVHSPLPKGNRVAIISLSGAWCVNAVDACVENGLRVAELSPDTVAKIQAVYPDWWHVRNPVDIWTAVEANGVEVAYPAITRAALEDDNVDAVVVTTAAVEWLSGKDAPGMYRDLKRQFPGKPLLVANVLGDRNLYMKANQGFVSLGIPSYTLVEDAITALAAQYHYQEYLRRVS